MPTDKQEAGKRKGDRNRFLGRAVGPVALFVLVTVTYLPSARLGFIHDDNALILEEPIPISFGDILSVFAERHWPTLPYYRPVSRLTMVVQKYLHGDRPAPYHLLNTVLMASLAVLAYRLLCAPAFAIPRPAALLGAGLMASHPAASCAVYPICSGRESLLPALFVVAGTRCYISSGKVSYFAALGFLALGLLSKEQAVVLPLLFLLADILGLSAAGRPGTLLAWVRRYAPMAVILLAILFLRWWLFDLAVEHRVALIEQPFGPPISVAFAAQTICTPFVQLIYEPFVEVWTSAWRQVVCILAVVLLAAGAYRCWSTVRARFLFWLGWVFLALLPTANILVQEAPFAERYVLLALVGVFGMTATLASAFWDRRSPRASIVAAAVVLLAVYIPVSLQRAHYFRDDLTFYRQWLATNPESSEAHACLGQVFLKKGEWDKAAAEFAEALRIDPHNMPALVHLGRVFVQRGQVDEALRLFRRAVQLAPDFGTAHAFLGTTLMYTGDNTEAVDHLQRALQCRPRDAILHCHLGSVFARLGKLDEAQFHLEQAIRLQPDSVEALDNLGVVIMQRGGPNSVMLAYDCFRRALEIDPHSAEAHYHLGLLHLLQGDPKEARACFEITLGLDPGHSLAHECLQRSRAAMRRNQQGPRVPAKETAHPSRSAAGEGVKDPEFSDSDTAR